MVTLYSILLYHLFFFYNVLVIKQMLTFESSDQKANCSPGGRAFRNIVRIKPDPRHIHKAENIRCMMTNRLLFTIYAYMSLTSWSVEAVWSWKKPLLFFKEEEVISQDYTVRPQSKLIINALDGSIIIRPQTGNVLKITARKRGIPEEQPLTTVESGLEESTVTVNTVTTDPSSSVSVNYVIDVPKQVAKIAITSSSGPIKVEEGVASSLDISSINGNITVFEATQSIQAKTSKGSILIKQKSLPSSGSLFIETLERGNVKLILPRKINAELHARTFKGLLTCTIPVTLVSRTTVLTKEAWARLQREARGTLGSSGPPITIDVTRGNISITAQ